MRGPGCCLGSCLGLLLGLGLAAGSLIALARWAPERLERAVRWAAGVEPPRAAAGAQPSAPPADPKTEALRRKVRLRLSRLEADTRAGAALKQPLSFTEEEVQVALSDPQGALGGNIPGLRAELLPGKVRLSWKMPLFGSRPRPAWLARLPGVAVSVELAPEVKDGKLRCPVVKGKLAGLPLGERAARLLVPRLPLAPRIPTAAGLPLPAGVSAIEIQEDQARLVPAAPPAPKAAPPRPGARPKGRARRRRLPGREPPAGQTRPPAAAPGQEPPPGP